MVLSEVTIVVGVSFVRNHSTDSHKQSGIKVDTMAV